MSLSVSKAEQIQTYVALLKSYNQTTNIYSAKAYDHLPFHIQNCEILSELIGSAPVQIVDMGSGSGLPSIVLSICLPQAKVMAVESKARKTRFLDSVKQTLKLDNLTVMNADIMSLIRNQTVQPDIITAKAFAPYLKVISIGKKLARSGTQLFIPISQAQHEQVDIKTNPKIKCLNPYSGHYFLSTIF
jgi:16S rRNA (guanine527-N7)-methyltransferase